MYERNAIVLERYFDNLFGYDEKNNLKDNYLKYSNLVECSEKYKVATDSEDKVMQEYDEMAKEIKNIQKNQETLSQKNVKLNQERDIIFQNIAEESENIEKLFENLNKSLDDNNSKIRQNEQRFVEVIANFTEKSNIRNELGKERKQVESDYSKALSESLEIHKNLNKDKLENANNIIENSSEVEKELYEKIKKNGEKEKVPFDNTAIKSAIKLEVNIQKKEIEILCNINEKTNRLFLEIKNNALKIERHQKQIKDSKAKLEFLNGLKEYVVQFLDNERLAAVNGENEHKKQMKEACKNFEDDLIQINNMYELLLREISSKANKKMYKELYNAQYLKDLEKSAAEFEKKISTLNLYGTIIDPNHWRVDGMKKIYTIFRDNVTQVYGRDLSEFEIKEEDNDDEEDDITVKEIPTIDTKINEKKEAQLEDLKVDDSISIDKQKENNQTKEAQKTNEEEFDEKIDMILGFNKKDSKINSPNNEIFKFEMQNDEIINQEDEKLDLENDGFWDDEDLDDEDAEDIDWEDEDIEENILDEDIDDEDLEDDEFLDDYDEEIDEKEEVNIIHDTEDNPWKEEISSKDKKENDKKTRKLNDKNNKTNGKSKGLLSKFIK